MRGECGATLPNPRHSRAGGNPETQPRHSCGGRNPEAGGGEDAQVSPFKVRANAPLSGRRLPATSGGGGYSASEGYN